LSSAAIFRPGADIASVSRRESATHRCPALAFIDFGTIRSRTWHSIAWCVTV
jgi:hypothetical protein